MGKTVRAEGGGLPHEISITKFPFSSLLKSRKFGTDCGLILRHAADSTVPLLCLRVGTVTGPMGVLRDRPPVPPTR